MIDRDQLDKLGELIFETRRRTRGLPIQDEVHTMCAVAEDLMHEVRRLRREAEPCAETWEEDVVFIGGDSPDNAGWVIPQGICDDPEDFTDQVPGTGHARRDVWAGPWRIVTAPLAAATSEEKP